ncbi:MAG: SDR family oxidoreductase [Bryobacteraceae bacterium]|jgi:NAD(P)-dependent dehydrogenase (short-subunit alcohol dehydrogenase family)
MSTRFLEQRNAIVTGGTRGIGLAVAKSLAQAGATVAICGRTQDDVDRAVYEISSQGNGKIVGRTADVSNSDQVAEFFRFVDASLGSLDILINNAGIGIFKPTADLTLDEWRRVIDTNLTGAFYCAHEALPRLRQRGGGYIINMSSLAGKNPFAGAAAYNASKFGLNGFSEAMMLDHRYDDIRVSYIMPGSVDTQFGSHTTSAEWKIAPEDISAVVLMLLQMPQRTLVSRVEIRPSKPKK